MQPPIQTHLKCGIKLTSSTISCSRNCWSSTDNFLEATISGLIAMIITGFSGTLVQYIQSLRGSSCDHIVWMLDRSWTKRSGLVCIILMVSLAVVDKRAGKAAEKVYADAEIRWWWTISSEPAQNPPPPMTGPAREPTIISTSAASTFWCSVMPRPLRPRTPNDQVSSKIRRNLYLNLSSI